MADEEGAISPGATVWPAVPVARWRVQKVGSVQGRPTVGPDLRLSTKCGDLEAKVQCEGCSVEVRLQIGSAGESMSVVKLR